MDALRDLVPGLPVTIALAAYLAVRVLVVLTAVFGREKQAERALAVLKLMRREKLPGVHDG